MGQQQLLLLVLGIVIVGLAVAVGIEAFRENQRKVSMDQTVQTAVEMGARAILWKQTPAALGGGAVMTAFGSEGGGADLADFGYTVNGAGICDYASGGRTPITRGDNCVITEHGEFHLARRTDSSWQQRNSIGYIHAITRYGRNAYRIEIIEEDGGRLHTAINAIRNGRAALPMPD
jgi:hypothetical protein